MSLLVGVRVPPPVSVSARAAASVAAQLPSRRRLPSVLWWASPSQPHRHGERRRARQDLRSRFVPAALTSPNGGETGTDPATPGLETDETRLKACIFRDSEELKGSKPGLCWWSLVPHAVGAGRTPPGFFGPRSAPHAAAEMAEAFVRDATEAEHERQTAGVTFRAVAHAYVRSAPLARPATHIRFALGRRRR